jgi:hypothetical protein
MHPRRASQLIGREASIRTEPSGGMDIAVDGWVGLVWLLNPERHRTGDQHLEFDIARDGHHWSDTVSRDAGATRNDSDRGGRTRIDHHLKVAAICVFADLMPVGVYRVAFDAFGASSLP